MISTKILTTFLRGGVEQNPLNMSDEQILEEIYSTHVHSDIKLIDEHTLFAIVQNTLKRSTHIVDNLVQGSKANLDLQDHHTDGSNTNQLKFESFDSPLCIIRKISSEMSCKLPPSGDTAHNTTLSILKKLSLNEWDAKAVLTLAAFAIEYGDFWLLARHESTDGLAKSMALLKRVPILTTPSAVVAKHRQAIFEINNLVKTTVQVIELILQFDSYATYNTKDVPALEPAMEHLPVFVYWSIITIAAIVTQIDCLTTESEHKQELFHYGQKINIILTSLTKHITQCNQQIEYIQYEQMLRKLFQTPTEITEVLKLLIFPKDAPKTLFYSVHTKTTVEITVLSKKNVYLFISTLDITEEELSVVRTVYESIKTNKQYEIVWIPMVEEWNEQLRKKFESEKNKIPWYVVHNFEIIRGYKFIQKEWNFNKKPMIVALTAQAKIDHNDAFHFIQGYGIKAFPFGSYEENLFTAQNTWVDIAFGYFNSHISNWVKENKYIFFYGGNDKDWIQRFTKHATILATNASIKEANISIELISVENEDRSVINRFWHGIESLFVTKIQKKVDVVTKEVQKMLTFKNETGWALLSKGSSLVLSDHGNTFLKTLTEFEQWKGTIVKYGSFEAAFKNHHDSCNKTHRCSYLQIPIVSGKLPQTMKCFDCPNTMEIFIGYKCCHDNNNTTITTANGN